MTVTLSIGKSNIKNVNKVTFFLFLKKYKHIASIFSHFTYKMAHFCPLSYQIAQHVFKN